jgi:hypothetical protein
VSYIDIQDIEEITDYLKNMEYQIYSINGCKLVTIEDIFLWIKNELPQDPPLSGKVNFDALVDSLWGGFDELDEEKVAILWSNPKETINKDKTRYETLIDCFEEIAKTLTMKEYGIEKPISLKTVLLDKGKLYSRFGK